MIIYLVPVALNNNNRFDWEDIYQEAVALCKQSPEK